jgi:hypothetical protein
MRRGGGWRVESNKFGGREGFGREGQWESWCQVKRWKEGGWGGECKLEEDRSGGKGEEKGRWRIQRVNVVRYRKEKKEW